MTEGTPEKFVYDVAPLGSEQINPISASQQIYELYTGRISQFPGFRQRPYHEAKGDYEPSFIEAEPGVSIEQVRTIIDLLVTNESYSQFKESFATYWEENDLERGLAEHSYVVLTGHRFFSDLPIIGTILKDIRKEDPQAAMRNVLIAGRMVPGIEVDMFDNGQYQPVSPMLRWIARQVQNVPSIPPDSNDAMEAQRRLWNEEMKEIFELLASVQGNIFLAAGSSSQDTLVDGKKLIMHAMSEVFADMLINRRLRILPLFLSCDSFSGGLHPGTAKYKFGEVQTIRKREDAFKIMEQVAEMGSEVLEDEGINVAYDQNLRKKVRKTIGKVASRVQDKARS